MKGRSRQFSQPSAPLPERCELSERRRAGTEEKKEEPLSEIKAYIIATAHIVAKETGFAKKKKWVKW